MLKTGFPAYTTSAGWLGYSDEKLRGLCRTRVAQGWTHFKQKVGANLATDIRRAGIIREEIGWQRTLMMDANQVWDVGEAITSMRALARFKPLWIEEPTKSGRHSWTPCNRGTDQANWRGDGRSLSEPGHVQAVFPSEGDQLLSAR